MRRLLFVDDEPMVLRALRRSVERLGDWEIDVATSHQEALQKLAGGATDAVVSDMQMPDGNGLELLTRVRQLYPDTVRLVLTGQSLEAGRHEYHGIVHQVLSKPWEPRALHETLQRIFAVRGLIDDPRFRRSPSGIDGLPSVPEAVLDLARSLHGEETTAQNVAQVIARDPVIAAKIMQLVNTAFFATPRRITSLSEAVIDLGVALIRNLLISAAVFRTFAPHRHIHGFDLEPLQVGALWTARLASRMLPEPNDRDDAFAGGLLRWTGQLVLAAHMPDYFEQVVALARQRGISVFEAEASIHSVSHAEVGAYVLGLWGLPAKVVQAVATQYRARPHERGGLSVSDAVFLAGHLVREAIGRGHAPALDPAWIESRGLQDMLKRWRQLAAEHVEDSGSLSVSAIL